jgi:hypothetical protein
VLCLFVRFQWSEAVRADTFIAWHDIFIYSHATGTWQNRTQFSPHDILWKIRLSYRAENRPFQPKARYIEIFSVDPVVFFEKHENQHYVPLPAICESDTCSEKIFTCGLAINEYPVVRTGNMKGKLRNKYFIFLGHRSCGGKKPGKYAQQGSTISGKMSCGSETEAESLRPPTQAKL